MTYSAVLATTLVKGEYLFDINLATAAENTIRVAISLEPQGSEVEGGG